MQEPVTRFEVDGLVIWAKRMQAGIEVKQLARLAGVSDSYVRKLERGTRKHLTHGTYQRFRAALNANETELLAPPRNQSDERK